MTDNRFKFGRGFSKTGLVYVPFIIVENPPIIIENSNNKYGIIVDDYIRMIEQGHQSIDITDNNE